MATATKKHKIESLTATDQRALEAARSEWLKAGLSTEPADRPEAEAAVKDLYAVVGLKEPMIVWMDSPLGGVCAAAWFEELSKNGEVWDQVGAQVGDQVWDQVGAQVGDQVWDQVGAQVRAQVGAQVGAQVWDQVGAQVWDQVGAQVGAQVWDQVGAQVGAQVWDQVGAQVWDQVGAQVGAQVWDQVGAQVRAQVGAQVGAQVWDQVGAQVRAQVWDQVGAQVWDQVRAQVGAQVWDQVGAQVWDQVRAQVGAQVGAQVRFALWGQHEAGWIAWANAMREIGVEYDKRSDGALAALSRIARSCGWWWPREGVVILTERPTVLHRDPAPANRLHCEDGPAILYPDGWGIWAWHGIRIEQEIIEDPKALNAKRITEESNAELRRAYMEIYGTAKYMEEAGGEMLDKVHEPAFPGLIDAELWRMPNPDGGEPFVCVKCRNSTPEPDGTFKYYHLWVHPECRPLLPENEYGEPQFGDPQELTAHNALASTYGECGETYAPAVET